MRKYNSLPIAALCLSALSLGGLTACGDDNEPGPGGVSEGEAAALDDAAEIIEARRLPEEALPKAAEDSGAPLPPAQPEPEQAGDGEGAPPSGQPGSQS
ncbi:MAG: hypothetical protein ABJP34_04160 [Erythrobacter sp.]